MTDRREDILNLIRSSGLVVIARNISPEDITDVANALYKGGIRLIEITFSQDGDGVKRTATSIDLVRRHLPDDMVVGAGTVLTEEQLLCAGEAGAEFILSPGADEVIIRLTREMGLVSVPGVLTASEVYAAYTWGADIVKLFPAGELGTGYLKALRGPLNHIPFMVVGGIYEENIGDFLKAGAMSFGIGSNILKPEYIKSRNYEGLFRLAEAYIRKIREAENERVLDHC